MTEAAITAELAHLRAAIADLQDVVTSVTGARLSRAQLAARLRVHRNTMQRWMLQDPRFPLPDRSGHWLLSDVIEWERGATARPAGRRSGCNT